MYYGEFEEKLMQWSTVAAVGKWYK
jgi:hypothetical protein